jgi:Pyrimidine deaminase
LEGATLYVNLEPCSHQGKTPPCVDRIIEEKIKRVVIGTLDVNPLVSGNGVRKLKRAGIDVKVGVLEKECLELNKFFFKNIVKKFLT